MLTIVPTPIGNLEDMTPRALRALKEASTVYCEDTRRTRQLMSHFGLSSSLLRYDEHDPRSADQLLERLRTGAACAVVSDGGLPGVSDPGRRIVAMARKENLPVTALPGPCAVVTALAGSGLPADSFIFLGFLPRSGGKQKKILEAAAALRRTIVIYESPFRVLELLETAEAALGPKAQACVARELSKIHEEYVAGTLEEVRKNLSARDKILGEFVVMLHPDEEPEHAV
jgi:16S rRNA (cytidine1402-2'-O)-methyltransferase